MSRSRFSIAGVVIAGLVTAATLLFGSMGYGGYRFLRDRQQEEFRERHDILANQLAASLTLPLWNFDRDQIAKVIESAMQDRDVYRIVVRSAHDPTPVGLRARNANWNVVARETAPPPRGLAEQTRTIAFGGETIGEVRIARTSLFLEQQLRRASISILGLIAVIDLLLIVGLYVLLWRTVLRPLQEVERHALAVSSGAAPASQDGQTYLGELDSLRASLEKMVTMLEARYADLSRSEARYRGLAEDLRESEEKFSKAFRSSPDAMAIAELESGRFLEVNDGFERLFGYPRSAVLGSTGLELGIWQPPAARERFVQAVRARGAVREMEFESRNRNGGAITCLLSAECMEFGGRTCVVAIIQDITDRKHAEAERVQTVARERAAREEFTRRLLAGQEAERRRIASELHDSLGQNLLLVKNRAQLALAAGATPPELRWQFESIQDLAAQAISEVRQISHDLRPYQLDQLGLTRALEAMLEGAARNTGLPLTHRVDPVDDLFVAESATHLYRIVQESVSNILKHARAKSARVLLERDVHEVRLWIEDDGCSFAPASGNGESPSGLGLRNIAERARIIGGKLTIDATPGSGTRIEVVVPIKEAA